MSWILWGCCGLYGTYCCTFCSTVAYTLIKENIEEKYKKKEKLKEEYRKVTKEFEDIEKASQCNNENTVIDDYKKFLEEKINLNILEKNKNLYPIYENEENIPINQVIYR